MPVAGAFAYIGTALGASATTATAVGVTAVSTVVAVGATAYSISAQNKALRASAETARRVADYNSKVDEADAKQIESDAAYNARIGREQGRIFTSRQQSAYAANGVLSSASPLAVAAMSAGRVEQQVQQQAMQAKREAAKRRDAAKFGMLYGQSQAQGYDYQARASLLSGGASILSTVNSAYQAGVFTGGKSPLSTNG